MQVKFRQEHAPVKRSPEHSWVRGVNFTVEMMQKEVDPFGELLLQEFPTGIFVPSRYYSGPVYWEAEDKEERVIFARSIKEGGERYNSAESYFRVPWPEDLASGDPMRLLGVTSIGALYDRSEMRGLGRYLNFSWSTDRDEALTLDLKKVTCDCSIKLIRSTLRVGAVYNSEDLDVLRFLSQVENLLMRITTNDFASYDPCTAALINPNRHNALLRRTEGVVRYASLHDHTYFGFCNRRDAKWEVMGPRPEVRAAYRKEAGLGL